MEEEFNRGRLLLDSKSKKLSNASKLLNYGIKLLTTLRPFYAPGAYQSFEEESIAILICVSKIIEENQTSITQELFSLYFSYIVYISTSLSQIERIIPFIDRFLHLVSDFDVLFQFYFINKHKKAIAQLLETQNLSPNSILLASISLSRFPEMVPMIESNLHKIENQSQVAILKSFFNFTRSTQPLDDRLLLSVQILTSALESDITNSLLYYNLAFLYAMLGEKEKSFTFVKNAFNYDQTNEHIFLLLSRILRSNCQFQEVVSLVKHSRKVLDRWSLFLCVEGLYSALELQDDSMVTKFSRVLKKKFPTVPVALFHRVFFDLMIFDLNDAENILKHWSVFDSQSPEFFFSFGQVSLATGNFEESSKYIKLAVNAAPKNTLFLLSLGSVFSLLGEKSAALSTVERALSLDPKNIHGWITYSTLVQGEEKKQVLEKVVALRPNYVDLSYLDFILSSNDSKILLTTDK